MHNHLSFFMLDGHLSSFTQAKMRSLIASFKVSLKWLLCWVLNAIQPKSLKFLLEYICPFEGVEQKVFSRNIFCILV